MIQNRTILYKYDTDFGHRNTLDDCQTVLKLSSWIGSWDEWAPRLRLNEPVPIAMDPNRLRYDQAHQAVIFPQIIDVMQNHTQIYRQEWRQDPFHKRRNNKYIDDLGAEARECAAKLLDVGVDFLFGAYPSCALCEFEQRVQMTYRFIISCCGGRNVVSRNVYYHGTRG
jgi:hypothetical protein